MNNTCKLGPTLNQIIAGVILTSFLWGCVTDQENSEVGNDPRSGKYSWIGKHRDELVAEFGTPSEVIDTTLRGRPTTESYIYSSTTDDCVDAFAIVERTGEIIDYFCR